jgi:chromosomal replication initiator protein
MSSIWEEVKNQVKTDLSAKSFSLWIHPLTLLEKEDNTLVLGCPNKFSRNWIKDNYMQLMEEKLHKIADGKYQLVLKVKALDKKNPFPDISHDSKQLTLPNMPVSKGLGRKWLNNEFTFDRFVVGQCNEFAYSAAKALVPGDYQAYNPLFMLANTGLGKSHLAQAIGHAILGHDSKVRVCYVTAEDFLNEMIFALKNNRIDEFKNKYRRHCDVLLLEEVHFLAGKEKIQLELGYTLDALQNERKKIIFTSSLLPKDIPNMTKELSSRLTSGIITTLNRPDYKTRIKVLERKSLEQHLSLPEEIIHLLAQYLIQDVRQMESALKCLKAKSELMKAKITTDVAKEVIQCHVPEEKSTSIEDIKKLVCQYFKVDPLMLLSKSRKKIHSYPRSIYVYLCRHYTDATLEDIGRSINRNHSTVLYASEVIEHKMKVDNQVKKQVKFLRQRLEDNAK